MTSIDTTDARILDLIQREFPLKARPFDALAELLSIEPADVLNRIKRLKYERIIRQISGIFDSRALGYQSSLVACKVASKKLEYVASEISKHPGVSHCYSRDADYNLWFTITLPPESNLESEVIKLAVLDGVSAHTLLPAIRIFKIGVYLRTSGEWRVESGEPGVCKSSVAPSPGGEGRGEGAFARRNVEQRFLKEAVRALQTDLPLEERPFQSLAIQKNMSEDQLISYADDFLKNGTMRRYSAVLNHRNAGYTYNAMICWIVSPDKIEETGAILSQHPAISHCYERPTFPDWPYSLYTMVHAQSQPELDKVISDLARSALNSDNLVLNTIAEFKKSRVLYFE